MTKYLLDTNLLLRAVYNDASSQHQQAVDAIDSRVSQGDEIFITPQNLIEFWSVASRNADANGLGWSIELVNGEIERMLGEFSLLDDVAEIVSVWREISTKYRVVGRRVHDSRLVAVMIVHRVTHLITFNAKDFRQFTEITVVDPGQIPGVEDKRT